MYKKALLFVGLSLIVLLALPEIRTSAATQSLNWSIPERVPGMTNFAEAPYMIADDNRVVHAFHSQQVDGKVSIVYSTWDYEHGWTLPVDILLPPSGEALIKGVTLDKKGVFHLIYAVGDQFGGEIYYASAPASAAGYATVWSKPIVIGKDANMFAAALASDNLGNFYVFYGGTLEGNGLYEVNSHDFGITWSEPDAIFLTNNDELWLGSVDLLMDENSDLHIAWSVWKPPIGALELYYARLNVDTEYMSTPIRLSGGGADTPTFFKHNDVLFLIYATGGIANGIAGKAMQLSNDGGQGWSASSWAFPPLVGGNGYASLVRDDGDDLYAFLANRTGDCCHGVWYSAWEGSRWSRPRSIIQGPKTPEFDPYSPRAVISQGNVILVTWWNESHNNGIWYSFAKLNKPEMPLIPLPTFVSGPTPTKIVATSLMPTIDSPPATLPVKTVLQDMPRQVYRSPNLIILIGILPALMLVALVVVWRSRH